MTALSFVVASCLLVTGLAWLLQERLLYYPAPASVQQLSTATLRAWPSAQDFRGLIAEPAGAARATAIVFHGNAGHAGDRDFYARALTPLGLRVILAEYPGYGPRRGKLGEASLVGDAVETIALAQRQFGAPLLLVGESLGSAVAAAAVRPSGAAIAGLLLITPWDELAHVGAFHYPLLPVDWLLRDRYETLNQLAGFDRPVVVAIAEHDSIVPPRFGKALFAGLGGPKHLVVIAGADHNDWPGRVDASWWRSAIDLVSSPSR